MHGSHLALQYSVTRGQSAKLRRMRLQLPCAMLALAAECTILIQAVAAAMALQLWMIQMLVVALARQCTGQRTVAMVLACGCAVGMLLGLLLLPVARAALLMCQVVIANQ
jgi:hypothetical protein